MTRTLLYEGAGFSIGRDDVAHTVVPYPPVDHGDGHYNQGFVDLADHPELASTIHEALRSPGLMSLLQEVNRKGSPFRTVGCECGLFEREAGANPDRYIGSYIAIAFRNPRLNTFDRLYELTRQMLGRTPGNSEHNIAFEITIGPLKSFFGHDGCFEMRVNAVGNGNSEDEAWAAFSFACQALSQAFEALNELPASDPQFALLI